MGTRIKKDGRAGWDRAEIDEWILRGDLVGGEDVSGYEDSGRVRGVLVVNGRFVWLIVAVYLFSI